MKLDAARTWHSRLTSRTSTDPTASARALRAVLAAHEPTEDADRPGQAICAGAFYPGGARTLHDGRTCLDGTVDDRPAPYPCATVQTVALELGIPLPESPTYEALIDG